MPGVYNIRELKPLRRRLRKSQTLYEAILWSVLRNKGLGFKFYRQYGVDRYILDFYCHSCKLAIELDGGHHYTPYMMKRDAQRTKCLEEYGIKVMRFANWEVYANLDDVVDRVRSELNRRHVNSPNPSLNKEGHC